MITVLKLVYLANIIVAGWISISSLFFPKTAWNNVFAQAFHYSESIRLIGALWLAIFVLSILGLYFPLKMSLVLFFQLIYKSAWLIFVALPALLNHQPFPKAMAMFFIIWVIILPFVIPWKAIFET